MTKSESKAIFNALPVQIDILNASLQVAQRIYLLGDQPKSVRDTVAKEGVHSKKLKHIFEFPPDVRGGSQSIHGGDIDWEDLDDEDFETIINAEPPSPELDESYQTNTNKQLADLTVSEHIDYNIIVFGEDTVSELQKKIAVVAQIDPAKQYLSVGGQCMTHYINYQAGFDSNYTDRLNLVEFLQECQTKINDMPMDENYILTKYNSTIVDTQANKLNSFLLSGASLHVVVVSLDVVVPNKNTMQFLFRSDKQSFELIFESVVERFFIMMNSQMFTEYLANHELDFDSGYYKSMINNQTKIIMQLNKIPKVSPTDKHLTITTNAITLRSEASKTPILILPKLFNNFSIFATTGVFYLDLFMTNGSRLMQVRKVSKYAAQAINFMEGVSMNIKPLASSIREYKTKDRIVITLLPLDNFSKLVISFDVFGQVEINAYSKQSVEVSKTKFAQEVSNITKHILDYINTLTSAFVSALKIDTHLDNYKILKSTSNLMFSQRYDYDSTVKYMISDLSTTGILEIEPQSNINIKHRSFTIRSNEGEKSIQIISNTKLALFTLVDLSMEETAFYIDLIGRFVKYRASALEIKLNTASGIQAVDPVLFKYRSKSNMNYSRVCQKRFQPNIALASDSNAYKYHNFTFNEPQYYKCPTKENPFLGLLPGYHPSGYCLPCCRKQAQTNRSLIVSSCISGQPIEEPAKLSKSSSKYYVIDYPNDLIANSRLVSRISNVPDFINKMLTKGDKLIINGVSISYSEPDVDMQMINILVQYLNKKSSRELIMDLLEYLKDQSNHRRVLSMNSIGYTFDSIDSFKQALVNKFLKQTVLHPNQSLINWNDIIIDLAICMNVGIALLSDNRIKASDCAHVVNQAEECSDEPVTTLNASIKLLKLEYIDFTRPILVVLRRVDTEYSKVHNNRRYFYYPILSKSTNDPQIEAISPDTVEQLHKIKSLTKHSITTVIDRSFNYQALLESIKCVGKVATLYEDDDNHIAYGGILVKPARSMLVSLYRSPNTDQATISLKRYANTKPESYTGTLADIIKLIECHNSLQVAAIDISDFQTYLSINAIRLQTNREITLPMTARYLLKVDKFIIHSNAIVATRVCVVSKKTTIHTIIFYHKATAIVEATKLLSSKQQELSKLLEHKPTKSSATSIATMAIDMVHRSASIVYKTKLDEPFAAYFCEYLMNPSQLIDNTPTSINYPSSPALKHTQYMTNIYKITINALITYWKANRPTELIKAITKLISASKPDVLRMMSNNLIEDWIDRLTIEFAEQYHPNVISAELHELHAYMQNNARTKTKDAIIAILSAPDLPLNDIDLHNLTYARREQIVQFVHSAASKCLEQTNTIPDDSQEGLDNIFEQYKSTDGKLLVLKSIYNDLLDLAVADLTNPFRREYVLDNCMINSFVNSVKIKSYIDELIYMQEL